MKQSDTNDQNMIQSLLHMRRQLAFDFLGGGHLDGGKGDSARSHLVNDFSKPGWGVVQNILNYARALEVIRLKNDIQFQIIIN